MSDDVTESTAPLDEQLVAYLDGELDAENSRRIEAMLASNAEVRRRLQSLERTWDLLDQLDATGLGEPFTRTTLEMVAVAAGDEAQQRLADAPRRRRRRRLAVAGSLLAAAVAGFLAVFLWADPNRRLLQNLPVLENFDEYRQAESVEFLRMLRDQHLFAADNLDRPEAASDKLESLAARERRVRAMSAADQEELQRAEERFADLDAAERQRLWKLHDDLQQAPDAAGLRSVLHRYHEWLKTLSAFARAELVELEPAGRIPWIQRRLEEEQAHRAARPPNSKDMDKLLHWMAEYAASHESQLLASLSEAERKELAGLSPRMRARRAFWQAWQHWQAAEPGKLPPMLSDKDLAALRTRLSPEVRKRLEALPSDRQWQLVIRWLAQSMQHPIALRGLHGPLTGADDKRLADFFEKDLTDQERDWLLGLPGEEMQQQLQRLFFQRQFRNRTRAPGRPGFRPDDAHRGFPPGRPPRNEPPPEKASPEKPQPEKPQPEKTQPEKTQPKNPPPDKSPPSHG
jgi:hypothetical protein